MNDLTVKFNGLENLENGNYSISFEVDKSLRKCMLSIVSELGEWLSKGKEKFTLSLKQIRQKRSLDANAYLWVLLQKIAEQTGSSKDEVYLKMLQRYSRAFTHVIVKPEAVDRVKEEWRTTIELGAVEVRGTRGIQLQCYFGSSTFDSKEMSVLIDGVVSECQLLGIETMTPRELGLMCEKWNNEKHSTK